MRAVFLQPKEFQNRDDIEYFITHILSDEYNDDCVCMGIADSMCRVMKPAVSFRTNDVVALYMHAPFNLRV